MASQFCRSLQGRGNFIKGKVVIHLTCGTNLQRKPIWVSLKKLRSGRKMSPGPTCWSRVRVANQDEACFLQLHATGRVDDNFSFHNPYTPIPAYCSGSGKICFRASLSAEDKCSRRLKLGSLVAQLLSSSFWLCCTESTWPTSALSPIDAISTDYL